MGKKESYHDQLIKGIERKIWLRARVKALKEDWRMGWVVTELLRLWTARKVKIPKERGK